MAKKILLVDDDEPLRLALHSVLTFQGYEVTCAANVSEAIRHIAALPFDLLVTDLHMPGAGDGLTVVSAMRHANPRGVTLILSAYPEMTAASNALVTQVDETLVKPIPIDTLVRIIKMRLANELPASRVIESVASILERTAPATIEDWFDHVVCEKELTGSHLSHDLRCEHLPQLFRDLVLCLRSARPIGTQNLKSASASRHGITRHQQGYTAAMMVEESRILQVSIFRSLQANLATVDYTALLPGVMTIADEVDFQLSQAMSSYTAEAGEKLHLA